MIASFVKRNVFQISDTSKSGLEWLWFIGNDTLNQQNPDYCFDEPGSFIITLVVKNANGADTAIQNIEVNPKPQVNVKPDTTICRGDEVQLKATGANRYKWESTEMLPGPDPVVNPDTTKTFTVEGTDTNQCSAKDSLAITVKQKPVPIPTFESTICQVDSVKLDAKNPDFEHQWSTGSDKQSINISKAGKYYVTASNECF